MSSYTIVGRVGREPDLRFSNSGTAVCRFSVAVSRRKKNGDQWDEVTTWHDVTCFGDLAEHAAESVTKGDEIVAVGYVEEPRTYDKKDGTTGVSLPFVANHLALSLRWATAQGVKASKQPRPAAQPAAFSDEPF